MNRMLLRGLLVLCVGLIMLTAAPQALAHGHIKVGDYELVIGFKVEPAYAGEPNGLDLRVTDTRTNEPVSDLADTLQAEIIYGASQRTLELRPQWGAEGSYTADVLPTEDGDYTWRIFGEINGTPLDISMTSSPETFSAVRAKSVVAFPATDTTELQTANIASQSAQTATLVGIAGLVIGLAGLAVAFVALRASGAATAQPARSKGQSGAVGSR